VVHDLLHGLGHDPSGVQVRRDAVAAASQGAQAFTSGDEVVLGGSAPALDGPEGVRLLAHELVHVAQFHEARRQGQVPSGRSRATDPAERQAARMADELVTHGRVSEHPLVPASAAVHAQELTPAERVRAASSASAQVRRTPTAPPPLEITEAEMCALAVFCILEGPGDLTNTDEQLKVAAVIINRINSPNWEKEYGDTITGQAFAKNQFEVVKTYGLELGDLDSFDKAAQTLSEAKNINIEESRTNIIAFVRAAADPTQYGAAVKAVGGNTGFRGVENVNVFRRESPYDATDLASKQPSSILTAQQGMRWPSRPIEIPPLD
jgi:Domain of unknown function (DUF4157)/Cell Wall Hydrolase